MGRTLAWLADDLRADDNLALSMALRNPGGAAVVRVAPEARGRPPRTEGRRTLEDAAEARLSERLGRLGVQYKSIGTGDDASPAAACRRLGCTHVARNAAGGSALERSYRLEAEDDLAKAGIPLTVANGESTRQPGPGGEPADRPFLQEAGRMPQRAEAPEIDALRAFLRRLPDSRYKELMWTPGPDRGATSMLSAAMAAGTLSADRAMAEAWRAERSWLARNPDGAGTPQAKSFKSFSYRLAWRRGFVSAHAEVAGERPWAPRADPARLAA